MNGSLLRCLVVLGSLSAGACSQSSSVAGAAGGGGAAGAIDLVGGGSGGGEAVAMGGSADAGANASGGSNPANGGSSNGGEPGAAGATTGGADTGAGGGMAAAGTSGATDPGVAGDGDFTITAGAMQPDLTDKGAPKGKRFQFVMDSTKSTIFDGADKTLKVGLRHLTRQVTVYVPAQYKDGTPAPLMVLQDGPFSAGGWGDTPPLDAVSRALDNLTIASDPARKIPAFIAIGVENGGSDSLGSERGLEYDTLSDRYARFVELEVLPAILSNATIKAQYPALAFTSDPEGRATYGCSSGAAASFTMAWFRPDLFRRVITYSGTFVAQQNAGQPESTVYPFGAWEYHSSLALIANTEKKPLRVHLNVNGMDNRYMDAESTHHNWVLANQHMAAALKAKGYHYKFDFVTGLGHCDYNAWRATLADVLIWTWRGYPTN